ncbi:MAG: hypothetical protein GC201_02530 [Alphaproteobacteria bacterium]|nr:hypothetical protein [Alphaproteobacteria bacterium]
MDNPDQLPMLISFMLFTFILMGGLTYLISKWMKRHREMEQKWIADDRSNAGTSAQSQGHH